MPFRANFIVSTLLLGLLMPVHGPAMAAKVIEMADCEKSPFSGSWVSTDSNVAFLSKIEITDICRQITTKPVARNNPWAGALGREKKYIYREFTIRPTSTCMPVDCVWGRSKGAVDDKGALKARFSLFLSKRYLEIAQEKHTLRVRWRIKYNGGRRPDQLGETLLVRAD